MQVITGLKVFKFFKEPYQSKDRGWSWVICLAGFVTLLCSYGFAMTFGMFYAQFLVEFGQSGAKTAWVGSLTIALIGLTAPLATHCVKRWGTRSVTCIGSILMASSLILTSFMHKLDLMFATYSILYGCSSSLIHMSTFDALPRYFEKRLALAIGLISSGVGAGPLAFTPLLNYLMHLFDWRSALRIIGAGIGIASFVAGLCFTPKERNEKHPILEEKNHELVERPYKILFRNPSTYILVVTICIVCLSYVTSFIHQVQFAIDFGVPEEKAKTLPVFLAIGAIFGRIISGQLMDLNLIDGILLYQSLMLLGGITALVGSLARTYEQLVCYIIIFQLFDGGQQGLTYKATSMALGGEYANEAFSLILFFASISMMLGPVTVGLIVDQTNNYNSMFYFSGIPLITASLILFTLRFVKPRKITKETTGKDNLKNDLCVKYDSPEEDHLIQKISVV